eukprot:TRINITY_DN12022_c0_g1_i2.p1 TRINITY_DN12022_c0_g1~~TRINITY_DN12022_c0_g1_i2.p1  ORF type:complete len:365 (+),score=29.26 TRINITY_DN12022_c0_g1_i2:523-1617(+)
MTILKDTVLEINSKVRLMPAHHLCSRLVWQSDVGMSTAYLFAFMHDLAFITSYSPGEHLSRFWAPKDVDWRPKGMPTVAKQQAKTVSLSTEAWKDSCRRRYGPLKEAVLGSEGSRQELYIKLHGNCWSWRCMYHPNSATQPLSLCSQNESSQATTCLDAPAHDDLRRSQARGMGVIESPAVEMFRMLFKDSLHLQVITKQYLRKHGLPHNEPYLGIHLRTGIGTKEGLSRLDNKHLEKNFECVLKYERGHNLSPSIRWFLASDDPDALRKLQAWLKERGLNSTKALGNSDTMPVVHLGRSDIPMKHALWTFAEFGMLMRRSAVTFASVSGFSMFAIRASGRRTEVLLPQCEEIDLTLDSKQGSV